MEDSRVPDNKVRKRAIRVGLILFFAGACGLWFVAAVPFLRYLNAKDWIETPCKIVSSKGHWSGDRRDSHFRVYITFSYEWKGAQYESDDYQLFGWAEGRDVLKRHPAGSETLCFVNPENPHQAAIDRSFPVESVGIIVSSIFAVIGLVTIILAKLGKFDEDGEEPTHSTTQ